MFNIIQKGFFERKQCRISDFAFTEQDARIISIFLYGLIDWVWQLTFKVWVFPFIESFSGIFKTDSTLRILIVRYFCFVFIYKSNFICNVSFFGKKKVEYSFPECFMVTFLTNQYYSETSSVLFYTSTAIIFVLLCTFFNDSGVIF